MSTEGSINPQLGLPSYLKVPNTFRLPKEMVWAGISVEFLRLIIAFAIILTIPLITLIFIRNFWYQCFASAVILSAIILFFLYFRNYEMYVKNKLVVKFMIDEYKKLHGVYKFDADLDFLLTFVPIVEIFTNGIIEFVGKRFGILLRYYPPAIEDDQTSIETHIEEVKAFIHSVSGDKLIRFISCSRYQFVSPVVKKLQEKMNESNLPKPFYRLLVSLLKKIKSNENSVDVDFYIFIGFGKDVQTHEEATEKILTDLPGLLEGLDKAKINAHHIVDRRQLITEYRNFFSPLGVVKDVIN
jgi:hypothetical protein